MEKPAERASSAESPSSGSTLSRSQKQHSKLIILDGPSPTELKFQKDKDLYKKQRTDLERRRNDFRVYLEQSGVMDKLNKALLRIFEEPTLPKNPIEAFKKLIMPEGYDPETEELERLSREIKELQTDIAGITEENKKLRATLGMAVEVVPLPSTNTVTPSEPLAPTGNKDKALPASKDSPHKSANATSAKKKK
ncbi:hypothetical protein RvY_00841 [Ramazzottius varieornatus]|uniref:Uncharacterized protein n=1 Tax=Ramazzottius varieornatus TaxID=947166 RepID=A0A1D1UHU8_RAMVA|nr:hypothetical protein RvY_00841 [Ramazzottius varieornatus]